MKSRPARFVWRWAKGDATTFADLGNPRSTTTYDVCIADANGSFIYRTVFPAGDPAWRVRPSKSYKYGLGAGPTRKMLILRPGVARAASVSFVVPSDSSTLFPPYALPVTVRLRSSDGVCWANVFSAPALVNVGGNFRATGE